MKPQVTALILALAAAFAGRADAMDDATLRGLVEQRLLGDRTGACVAVAVVEDTVSTAYVCADPAQAARIDARTAFEIGSVSKTMAATLLAELIVQGKASLDDPLSAWLPGTTVPTFAGEPIRLRHLVTHTSGLPALPPGLPIRDPANPYAAVSVEALLASLEGTTLSRAPGTQAEYSNFALMLLSAAIARRTGTPFDVLLHDRLFAPLGMDGAFVGAAPAGIRAAVGHLPNGQPTPAWDFPADVAGVGGVRATLDDMVKYVQAELGRRPSPLADALALTQQPVAVAAGERSAMNWMLAALPSGPWHAHEGGTGGFSSFVAFDRAHGRGVIVLADTALHSLGGLGSLALHLADPSLPLGKPRKPAAAPGELLDALAGRWQVATMAMTLRRDGDTLRVQAQGQPEFALAYDDAGSFYPLQFDALLQPERVAGGGWKFSWHQGGGVVPATRLDPAPAAAAAPAPDAAALRAYNGDYPLMPQFALKVFERDGTLYLQGTGQPEFAMAVAAADVFVIESVGAELRFERDAGGAVTAVVLHQGGQQLRGVRQ